MGEGSMIPINDMNAVRAADFLLAVGASAISRDYQEQAFRFINALKERSDTYQQHLQKCYLVMFKEQTRSKVIQHNLESLVIFTDALAKILKPEAQELLASYLSDPNMKIPEMPFDKTLDDV
jgi:hypothetical protein